MDEELTGTPTLSDDAISTEIGTSAPMAAERPADGTDGDATDKTDGDATDGTDGDSGDADDADEMDAADADGTDATDQ